MYLTCITYSFEIIYNQNTIYNQLQYSLKPRPYGSLFQTVTEITDYRRHIIVVSLIHAAQLESG